MILHEHTPVVRAIDGGYLSWSYGAIGFKSWHPVRASYTRKSGTLICLDSPSSLRKEFDPQYKSHRKQKREKRNQIHGKVLLFQSALREDPSLRLWEVEGLEADDLIALLVTRYKLPIVAQDKDLFQLDGITAAKIDGTPISFDTFAARQSQKVSRNIHAGDDVLFTLVLMGDKSDDIPRLIPPRNLDLYDSLASSEHRWEKALQLFGDRLLQNLYLAVLPSPWCYEKVLSPQKVFSLVSKNAWENPEVEATRTLSPVITEYLVKLVKARVLR